MILQPGHSMGQSNDAEEACSQCDERLPLPAKRLNAIKSGQQTKRAPRRRQLALNLLKSWIPIVHHLLLIQYLSPILKTKCDFADSFQHPLNVMPTDFEDVQQKSLEYLVQQQHQQQQTKPLISGLPSHIANQMPDTYHFGEEISELANGRQLETDQQQQQFVAQVAQQAVAEAKGFDGTQPHPADDLLESQSNAASTASNGFAGSADSKPISAASSGGQDDSKPTTAKAPAISPSTSSESEQSTGSVGSLLSGGTSGLAVGTGPYAISDFNGLVTNSIIRPIKSQTVAMGNIVRKTIMNSQSGGRPSTGQSIDGNIEYDSNQNAINGNIEFPSFPGFGNGSSKPSLPALKPFIMAALKTVPIKLGSVGWKLLQLIAWKKIYKTHHPKSGEIIIEQELKSQTKGSKYHSDHGSGGKHLSKMMDMEIGSEKQPHKGSKMGHKYSSGYGDGMMGRHHSMQRWPYGGHSSYMDHPMMSGSVLYQRHARAPAGFGQQHATSGGGQNPVSSDSAAAAAAAAAATAAAIQSQQWIQQQLNMAESTDSMQNLLGGSGGPTTGGQKNATALTTPMQTHRKRSSLASGNWFVSPAQAYAAAAAAANAAATAAAVSQQHPIYRLGQLPNAPAQMGLFSEPAMASHPQPAEGLQHALAAGIMYQNLFDNAAAMAVQNAVKLPGASPSVPVDHYLDQSDSSLSGSSLALSEPDSSGWQTDGEQQGGLIVPRSGQLERVSRSQQEHAFGDHLLALNEAAQEEQDSQMNPAAQQQQLLAAPDFDDAPTTSGQYTSAPGANPTFPESSFRLADYYKLAA